MGNALSDIINSLCDLIDAGGQGGSPTVVKFPATSGDDGKWYVPMEYKTDFEAAIESGTLIYLYNTTYIQEYAIFISNDGEGSLKAFGSSHAEITDVAFGTPTEA